MKHYQTYQKHYKTDRVNYTIMPLLLHVLLTPAASPFADFDTLLLEGFVVIQHVSPAHPGAKLQLARALVSTFVDSQLMRSITSC